MKILRWADFINIDRRVADEQEGIDGQKYTSLGNYLDSLIMPDEVTVQNVVVTGILVFQFTTGVYCTIISQIDAVNSHYDYEFRYNSKSLSS